MSAERLKRVESFDELRVGMLVVVNPCVNGRKRGLQPCGRSHRGIITGHAPAELVTKWGEAVGLSYEPGGHGGKRLRSWFPESAVSDGRVFRVVDDSDDQAYRDELNLDRTLAAIRAHNREQVKRLVRP